MFQKVRKDGASDTKTNKQAIVDGEQISVVEKLMNQKILTKN